jgi:hypothetical protein
MTCPRRVSWSINAPTIKKIWWQAHDIDMPTEKRTMFIFFEFDYLKGLWAISMLKKQELHPCGGPAPDSKVDAFIVERGAQGIAISRTNLIRANLSAG